MASLSDLKAQSREAERNHTTETIARDRARTIAALAEAGVQDPEIVVDEALQREELSGYPPGDERLIRATEACRTLIALYHSDVSPLGNRPPVEAPLSLAQIEYDQRVQVRVLGTNPELVEDYAEAMRQGADFPPMVVFFDRKQLTVCLADGFHRGAILGRYRTPVAFEQLCRLRPW